MLECAKPMSMLKLPLNPPRLKKRYCKFRYRSANGKSMVTCKVSNPLGTEAASGWKSRTTENHAVLAMVLE